MAFGAPEVNLAPFSANDIPTLIGWIPTREFLIQWTASVFSWPLTREQLEQYFVAATAPDSACRPFKALTSCSSMVGYIELNRLDRENRSAVLSRVLVGPNELRGQGIGLEMVRRVLRIGFEEYHLHRIELAVYCQNSGAVRCYEKAGFRKEGVSRDRTLLGSTYLSEYRMAILEDEWRIQHAASPTSPTCPRTSG
jgi:RimJ/RimL family protein N-acetyltransferase